MKDYNSIKHTLLVFNSKKTLVDTIIEQDKKIDELKERLSIYESDNDTVVMTKNKWEETKQEIERLKEENLLLRASESMSKLQEDYGYKARIDKAINKIQYIIDYGFDYDGFNNVEDLKGLIDMLVQYAVESKNILKGSDKE